MPPNHETGPSIVHWEVPRSCVLGEQTRDRLWFLETLGELMVVIVWGLCSRWSVWHASLNPTKQLCGAGFPGYSQHAALHARIRKPDSLLQRWHQDAPLPVHSSCWARTLPGGLYREPSGRAAGPQLTQAQGRHCSSGQRWEESRKITLGPDFKHFWGLREGLAP